MHAPRPGRSIGVAAAVAALAAGHLTLLRPRLLRRGATDAEARRTLPGDELVAEPEDRSTMGTTLPAPPEEVWPWLAQMGCNRAGWYSWDLLDNGGRPSARRIIPEWQHLEVGDRLDSTPSGATWFTVALVDPPWTLALRADLELPSGRWFDARGPRPRAYTESVWSFHLEPRSGATTRLLVRTLGRSRPRLATRVFNVVVGEPAHVIMQSRQFHNLERRVARRRPVGSW